MFCKNSSQTIFYKSRERHQPAIKNIHTAKNIYKSGNKHPKRHMETCELTWREMSVYGTLTMRTGTHQNAVIIEWINTDHQHVSQPVRNSIPEIKINHIYGFIGQKYSAMSEKICKFAY